MDSPPFVAGDLGSGRPAQLEGYGRHGRVGFRLTITGYGLLLFGVVWDFVLFDPFVHPLHGIGFFASLVGLLLVVVGWIVWGIASYRAWSLPSWALPVPFLIVAGWIAALVFGDALYEAILIDAEVAIQIVSAIAVGVFGLVLWQADDNQHSEARTPITAQMGGLRYGR